MKMAERSEQSDKYPCAYSVPIDARLVALGWVIERVKMAYGEDDPIALRNVAELVDGVADAVAREDQLSALVRGSRLLSESELVELWLKLGGRLPKSAAHHLGCPRYGDPFGRSSMTASPVPRRDTKGG